MTAIEIRHKVNMEMGLSQVSKEDQESLEYYKELLLKINLLYEILGFTINIDHTKTGGGYYALITLKGDINPIEKKFIEAISDDGDILGIDFIPTIIGHTILLIQINF